MRIRVLSDGRSDDFDADGWECGNGTGTLRLYKDDFGSIEVGPGTTVELDAPRTYIAEFQSWGAVYYLIPLRELVPA